MKKLDIRLLSSVVLISSSIGFTACDDDNVEHLTGSWTVECSAPMEPRASAVSFVIDNVAYIGTGVNASLPVDRSRFTDFYSCTTSGDGIKWLADSRFQTTGQGVSPMPEVDDQGNPVEGRHGAVAFSLNGKGYVGLGYTGYHYLKDFWEFDPKGRPEPSQYPSIYSSLQDDQKASFGLNTDGTPTGRWTKVADFPGDSCRYAVAFVLKGADGVKRAYVGSGENSDGSVLCRFFKFDGKEWASTAPCKFARSSATAFVYESDDSQSAFLCGGNTLVEAQYHMEVFDPISETWKLRDGMPEHSKSCVSFVVDDKAYITTGGYVGVGYKTWEYDILKDAWTEKVEFGSVRGNAVSFVLENDGQKVPCVALGVNVSSYWSSAVGTFYQDVWSFEP